MNRRPFLLNIGQALLLMRSDAQAMRESGDDEFITLFLCGDVMTGRGIDQVVPHPSDPVAVVVFQEIWQSQGAPRAAFI